MGIYLNPGRAGFEQALNSDFYVDKTGIIGYLNSVLNTMEKYVCVTRPRGFGKTLTAEMIGAYYDREAGSRELFAKCLISRDPSGSRGSWDKHLGQFDVIRLVMTDFMRETGSADQILDCLSGKVIAELREAYPGVSYGGRINLRTVMDRICRSTSRKFVIIIDEWDAVFRERPDDIQGQKQYQEFLRCWLKDKAYVALAYMTGILPIRKFGSQSALNMFSEFSMTCPLPMAPYTGFTDEEVRRLCGRYGMDPGEIIAWYGGYRLADWIPVERRRHCREIPGSESKIRICNPFSVIRALRSGKTACYWNDPETETGEALRSYTDRDFAGLKEVVAVLLAGGRVPVDISCFQNDLITFSSRDDILTLLIHLGYLGYDEDTLDVFIPNREVLELFRKSARNGDGTAPFPAGVPV